MPAPRILVTLATAALGLSLSAFAAGGGGGGGHGGGGSGKSEQHQSGDDAQGKKDLHQSGTEKDNAKGKRSAVDQLAAHPQLAERLSKLSGMSLTDLKAAAAGFKNFGQFVAAVHVSQNLGIPFDKLKAEMTKDGGSLGMAIKKLRPKANADTEEHKANKQAQDDLKQPS